MAAPAPTPTSRLAYLDGLRGLALIVMVLNHTARWWIDRVTWPRYHLIYLTVTLAAPTFLFLVGFCLPLSLRGQAESLGTLARRYAPRGARIVVAGLLLNLIVFPDDPVLSGGVLQTIGFAIIAMIPALWLMRYPVARWALLGVAVAAYVAFVLAFGGLQRFVGGHPLVGLVLFYDFPLWPWLSLVLIGLVMGWTWLQAYRRSEAQGARYLAVVAAVGAVMVLAFLAWDWWAATPIRFGLKRDFILNRHWTPRGASLLWVFGMLFLMLGAAYWTMERRRWRLPWLVIFGQTALFLYFIHQILAYTLVKQWLDWRFEEWLQFGLANAVFLLLLLGLGWAWLRVKRLVAQTPLLAFLRPARARAKP